MTHDVLQSFGIHTALCHVGAKCVSARVRCNLWKLNFIYAVILLPDMFKVLFPMQRNHGHLILVQEEESCVPVNHRFLPRLLSVFHNPPETGNNLWTHRDETLTILGLRVLNNILHVVCSLQLMIDPDSFLFEINVPDCQTAEFRNTQASIEQDIDSIIILAVILITLDK